MRTTARFLLALSLTAPLALLAACGGGTAGGGGTGGTTSSTGTTTSSSTGTGGAGTGGAGTGGAEVDKAAACAATFGAALTAPYGRIDGTVLAVVRPADTQCPLPNDDHVVLQMTMNGAVYRMVINVLSNGADPNVQYLELDHALPAPAWSEGWHTGVTLDYVNTLGVHAEGFTPHPMSELIDIVTDAIALGQKVSVYASTSGGASAHLIHRNGANNDGAIVLDADGAKPRLLLFHFADQKF